MCFVDQEENSYKRIGSTPSKVNICSKCPFQCVFIVGVLCVCLAGWKRWSVGRSAAASVGSEVRAGTRRRGLRILLNFSLPPLRRRPWFLRRFCGRRCGDALVRRRRLVGREVSGSVRFIHEMNVGCEGRNSPVYQSE